MFQISFSLMRVFPITFTIGLYITGFWVKNSSYRKNINKYREIDSLLIQKRDRGLNRVPYRT